jgi:hypothetical protein
MPKYWIDLHPQNTLRSPGGYVWLRWVCLVMMTFDYLVVLERFVFDTSDVC